MGEVLLAVFLIAGHTGVVFLLVSHQSLLDGELLVANVTGKGLVVDVGQYMLSQFIGGHKLARTEDTVYPAAYFVFFTAF